MNEILLILMRPWVEHAWNKKKTYISVLHVAWMNEILLMLMRPWVEHVWNKNKYVYMCFNVVVAWMLTYLWCWKRIGIWWIKWGPNGPLVRGEMRLWWMEISLCIMLPCEGRIHERRIKAKFPLRKKWGGTELMKLINLNVISY